MASVIGNAYAWRIFPNVPPRMRYQQVTPMLSQPRLLLIDEDRTTREILTAISAAENFELRCATAPNDARSLLATWQPNIVLVDLPALGDRYDLLSPRVLDASSTILIVVTGQDAPMHVRAAYAAGAEDFVRKPFDPAEMTARLKVALRSNGPPSGQPCAPFSLVLEAGRLRLTRPDGHSVDLTPLEARLIRRLLLTPGASVPREELMRVGWGRDLPSDDNALEVSVRRLRRKLEDDPANPRVLITTRGMGYVLRTEVA